MQRMALRRLKSAFEENDRSYSKTALALGLNRGTVYAILKYGQKASPRTLEKLGIRNRKRYYKNWRKKNLLLRRWIRKHAQDKR